MAKKVKEETQKSAFDEAMDGLNKTYGKGAVIEMNQIEDEVYDVVSTGSISFDHSLGIGGWLPGKLYELKGWEGTGKTTICGKAAANFQKKFPDKKVVYIDGEHAIDKNYLSALGVDVDKLVICQPDYGEMGFNVAEKLIATGEVSLVIIDSNTSLIPKKVVDGEAGDNALGLQARLNSQMYPKLKNKLIKGGTCVISVNQFREKIGVMFGSPVTTNGGHALKFYSDVIIEVSKTVDKEGMGNLTKIKVTKNKMAPPFVEGQFFIKWGEGIDVITELVDLGNEYGILKKWGSTITILDNGAGGETKYTLEEFEGLLRDNEDFYQELKKKVLEKMKGNENKD